MLILCIIHTLVFLVLVGFFIRRAIYKHKEKASMFDDLLAAIYFLTIGGVMLILYPAKIITEKPKTIKTVQLKNENIFIVNDALSITSKNSDDSTKIVIVHSKNIFGHEDPPMLRINQ